MGYRREDGRWAGDQRVRIAAGSANVVFWIRPLRGPGPPIINTGYRIYLLSLSNWSVPELTWSSPWKARPTTPEDDYCVPPALPNCPAGAALLSGMLRIGKPGAVRMVPPQSAPDRRDQSAFPDARGAPGVNPPFRVPQSESRHTRVRTTVGRLSLDPSNAQSDNCTRAATPKASAQPGIQPSDASCSPKS